MTRNDIGETLAARLHSAEAAIDHALAEAAALAALLPVARGAARIASTTAHGAFEGAAASVSALTDARGHLVRTHRTLGALARVMGLEALAMGPVDKPEDRPPVGGEGAAPALAQIVNKSLPESPSAC